MVVSVGGVMLGIFELNGLSSITGGATTDVGHVNLSIATSIGITTEDNTRIMFGSCTASGNGTYAIINSQATTDTQTRCSGFTTSKNITVRNNGNVNVVVNATPTDVGKASSGTFLESLSGQSAVAYRVFDGWASGYGKGCFNNTLMDVPQINSSSWNAYTNFTSITTAKVICANLTSNPVNNSVGVYIQIYIPNDAPTGNDNISLSFLAAIA
jgi:hypothetical protein